MAEIKKIIMHEHNGTDFDTLYPKTTAEQVETNAQHQFVSEEDKNKWDSKVDATSLGTAAAKDVGTASGEIPVLNELGKLDAGVIPDIAITDTFVIESESELTDLEAQQGDIAIVLDGDTVTSWYILKTDDPTDAANWQELPNSPTIPVVSVNGKTGAVVVTQSDVGLGNVENKTVAEILTDAILTGTPTAPTATESADDTQVANIKYVKDAIAEIDFPEGAVESVNGKTGIVELTKTDVGLGNVENKSVAEILTNAALTGTVTAPTPSTESNDTTVATTAFVKAQTANRPKLYVSETEPENLEPGDIWYQVVQ